MKSIIKTNFANYVKIKAASTKDWNTNNETSNTFHSIAVTGDDGIDYIGGPVWSSQNEIRSVVITTEDGTQEQHDKFVAQFSDIHQPKYID